MVLRHLFQMSHVAAAAFPCPAQPRPKPVLPTANTPWVRVPLTNFNCPLLSPHRRCATPPRLSAGPKEECRRRPRALR